MKTLSTKERLAEGIRQMHERQQAIAKMALDAAQKRYVAIWGRS